MSYPGFPSIFYSKEPLPTRTVLIRNDNSDNKHPKINWSTYVVDSDETQNACAANSKQTNLTPYYDNDEGLIDCMDIEDNYEIFPTKSGKFLTSFHVPSALIPVIIGPKGQKLRQLQDVTQTLIKVPRIHEAGMPVKITGSSERSVASARNQVTLVMLKKRESLQSTHFVSIPVNSKSIGVNYEKFKEEVLNDAATRGIDQSLFQNPNKLHMTIEVLTLLDESEVQHANQLLTENVQSILSDLVGKNSIEFRLKGVEIMNDDPTEVDVLYAKVQIDDEIVEEAFQSVVNQLSKLFYLNGYVRRQYDHVKLHVTLLNSLFRKGGTDKRTTFDASHIMKKYKDYDFGTSIFKNIDLSIRYSTGENGYYNSEVSIDVSTL